MTRVTAVKGDTTTVRDVAHGAGFVAAGEGRGGMTAPGRVTWVVSRGRVGRGGDGTLAADTCFARKKPR